MLLLLGWIGLAGPGLLACQGSPQIVAISPERNAAGVRTNLPIRVSFDRPVDQASVAARFRLLPAAGGQVGWESSHDLVFSHPPLRPDTSYTVLLEHGYRDLAGSVNGLDHSWEFRTEPAPVLVSTSPGPGDAGVDPAVLITLTFSREMDLSSLPQAISVRPGISPYIRLDPADGRRVQLATAGLLEPQAGYTVIVTSEARDADGNQLLQGAAISFASGPSQPLKHWITFIAQPVGGTGSDGVWMVDESRFARPLATAGAVGYSWAPDSSRLLVRNSTGAWQDRSLAGGSEALPLQGGWAGYLAAGQGYAYLSDGQLWRHRAGATDQLLATGVQGAAVAPGGSRLAYVQAAAGGSEIWSYDIGLRAQFRIQPEPGQVADLAWAPDGSRLAYRLSPATGAADQLRVRTLTGSGGVATVVSGQLEGPSWQADSRHLIFSAVVAVPGGGSISKAFRLAVNDPGPHTISLSQGLPAAPGVAVSLPRPSPDGHQIAFLGEEAGGRQVFLMNADGTGLTRLTGYDPVGFPYSCSDLAWTPV